MESHKIKIDVQMFRNIFMLVRMARMGPALVLFLLAIMEVLLVSRVGKVIGHFYDVFVDQKKSEYGATMLNSFLLYSAIVITISLSFGIGQMLSIQWRRRIVAKMHDRYLKRNVFCFVQSLPPQQILQVAMPTHAQARSSIISAAVPGTVSMDQEPLLTTPNLKEDAKPQAIGGLDNPDQRMTQDVVQFCEKLEVFIRKTAKSPFNLIVYTVLITQLFNSFIPVFVAMAYFCLLVSMQRVALSALASAINTYQKTEGDLRAAHMRLCNNAVPIAAWGGASVEKQHIDKFLNETLSAQTRMAWCFILQNLFAKVGDYISVVVNYGIIGAAVFYGGFTSGSSTDGATAQKISQASFYLIMLMNSLTSVLDASKQLGEVAGHTSRICDFITQMDHLLACNLETLPKGDKHGPFSPSKRQLRDGDVRAIHSFNVLADTSDGLLESASRAVTNLLPSSCMTRCSADEEMEAWETNESITSAFGGTIPDHLRRQAVMLLPPTMAELPDGSPIQLSIHRVEGKDLLDIVGHVFPDAPLGEPILAVCTYQPVPPPSRFVLRPAQVSTNAPHTFFASAFNA